MEHNLLPPGAFLLALGNLQEQVIGLFRYHNSTQVCLVLSESGEHVVIATLNETLAVMVQVIPSRLGVLTMFRGETLYTLKTKYPVKLQEYYDSTISKAVPRDKGSSYMAICT